VPTELFVPYPALLPSVEENLGQYSWLSMCDKYSTSSRSCLVDLCFSEVGSTPGSGPTTPGLKAIDPRILAPPKFNRDNAHQSYDQAIIQPNSLISHQKRISHQNVRQWHKTAATSRSKFCQSAFWILCYHWSQWEGRTAMSHLFVDLWPSCYCGIRVGESSTYTGRRRRGKPVWWWPSPSQRPIKLRNAIDLQICVLGMTVKIGITRA
jgi:hypothetical protein